MSPPFSTYHRSSSKVPLPSLGCSGRPAPAAARTRSPDPSTAAGGPRSGGPNRPDWGPGGPAGYSPSSFGS